MAIRDAKKAVQTSILSGFRHHDPSQEAVLLERYLTGLSEEALSLSLAYAGSYFDVMAPDRLRAMKNGFIAMATLVCRAAIRLGLDPEESYSLSDYYLYAVESCQNGQAVEDLALEALRHYAALVQSLETKACSRPVAKAVRYINSQLYQRCTVESVAAHIGLNAQYFSGLFRKETGCSPLQYIKKKKLDEGAKLLRQGEHSVGEIAEMLGFCGASHFARDFKKEFGITPKQFSLGAVTPLIDKAEDAAAPQKAPFAGGTDGASEPSNTPG